MRDQKISFFFFEGGPEDKLCSVFLLLGVNKLLKLTIDLHKKKGGGLLLVSGLPTNCYLFK